MSFIRQASLTSLAVFASRLLGLLREQLFSYFFGAGLATDAYLLAFRVPNLLRNLFAEGALSSAFVAVFSRSKNETQLKQLSSDLRGVLSMLLLLLTVILFFTSDALVACFAPDFSQVPGKLELAQKLTKILLPSLYLASMAALAMGILNSKGHFFVPTMASAAFNAGNILFGAVGAWWQFREGIDSAIVAFAWGTLFGAILQWTVQWPSMRRLGFHPLAGILRFCNFQAFKNALLNPELRQVFKLMGPFTLAVAALQLNVLINTWFAAGLQEGSVSYFSYSFRLLHFPMGLFGVALSLATLPKLSQLRIQGKMQAFAESLEKSLQYTLILGMGSAVGLWVFREALISLLFEHGQFTRHDTFQTAEVLGYFSFGLLAFNGVKICMQALYALDRVGSATAVALATVGINCLGSFFLAPRMGVSGLALSTTLASVFNLGCLLTLLARAGHWRFNGAQKNMFTVTLVGALLMVLLRVENFSTFKILSLRDEFGFKVFAFSLFLSMGFSAVVYLAFVTLVTREGRSVLAKLSTKLRRKIFGPR